MKSTTQIQYCNKFSSNTMKCSSVATHNCKFISKKNLENGEVVYYKRCDQHRTTATANKTFIESQPIDHNLTVIKVQKRLSEFVNNGVYSSFHRNKYPFVGKFVKDCGIMCQRTDNQKWIYVYYHQIKDFEL